MRHPKYGKLPHGEWLKKVQQSPNFKNGKFQNRVERPIISKGYSMPHLMYQTFFKKFDRRVPSTVLPTIKTDLKSLPLKEDVLVWFGHSSFYMHFAERRFLFDPVFSGHASPFSSSVKAFPGTDIYQVDDFPEIDFLVISHDHYDHLDYKTINQFIPKIKKVICGLGVGAHFEYWGFDKNQIIELDWDETYHLNEVIKIHTFSTHHNSGRTLKRSQSLWLSYVFEVKDYKFFYSGDGGYDAVYKQIGDKLGAIDFAMMECGQYNIAWQSVHKLPEEVHQATLDIHAKRMMPIHHSKFTLAQHSWDEPLIAMKSYQPIAPYQLVHPKIGELVYLRKVDQHFENWWEGIE